MKAKQLIEILSKVDPDADVILQEDSEGNGFSPLSGAETEADYIPDSTWSGEVFYVEWDADDVCMEEDEWEKVKSKPRCVVLYPVN